MIDDISTEALDAFDAILTGTPASSEVVSGRVLTLES
jgi:hypothetical protein